MVVWEQGERDRVTARSFDTAASYLRLFGYRCPSATLVVTCTARMPNPPVLASEDVLEKDILVYDSHVNASQFDIGPAGDCLGTTLIER